MIFNTWTYAAFVLITFLVYWFLVSGKYRAHVLLAASYLFFTYHFAWHSLLILIMTAVVYGLSLLIFKYKPKLDQGEKLVWYKHPKFHLTAIIIFCLSVLAFYKYLIMAIATLNSIFQLADFEVVYGIPSIIVPLGLSFFVFEFIHYAIDVYHGTAKKAGPFQFAVFIMYFPTLVSGPIKRYQSFNEQTYQMGGFRKEFLYEGLSRILIGLFKKIVIADQMTPFVAPLFNPGTSTTLELWIAMYAYAVKIYFDFSGYSDIAIGSAKLFGYKVPENFNYPYLQKNLAAFWNNWHMSLSSWIRDYVYIPLGGNRGSSAFAARNSLIAMAICGLWHGAAWHYVLWGLYHGIGLATVRFYKQWKKGFVASRYKPMNREVSSMNEAAASMEVSEPTTYIKSYAKDGLATLFTFHFVAFGWLLFILDFRTALRVINKMLGGLL